MVAQRPHVEQRATSWMQDNAWDLAGLAVLCVSLGLAGLRASASLGWQSSPFRAFRLAEREQQRPVAAVAAGRQRSQRGRYGVVGTGASELAVGVAEESEASQTRPDGRPRRGVPRGRK